MINWTQDMNIIIKPEWALKAIRLPYNSGANLPQLASYCAIAGPFFCTAIHYQYHTRRIHDLLTFSYNGPAAGPYFRFYADLR